MLVKTGAGLLLLPSWLNLLVALYPPVVFAIGIGLWRAHEVHGSMGVWVAQPGWLQDNEVALVLED